MPVKKQFAATNKGIEARIRKDLDTNAQELINGQAKLEEKARIYDQLSNLANTQTPLTSQFSERKRYIKRKIFGRF